ALGRVLQLGAGGAGYAVAHAVKELGADELLVFDPDRQKAEALVSAIVQRVGPGTASVAGSAEEVVDACDGIVNASPVGMAKYPGMPIQAASLRPRHWLADIIYFPRETELLAMARAMGCRVMTGDGMAAYQAAEAFRLFTGLTPDAEAMRRTLDDTNGIA
ncbi:shikimate dehydrogenase, partial [Rhizobiaceae sp. 2RAB30]